MTVKDKLKDQIKDKIEDSTADAINSSTQTGWDAFTGAANNVSSKYCQEWHEGIADGSIDQEKFPDPSSYARYRANQDKVNNQDYNDKVDKNVDGLSVLPANNLATKVGIKQAGEFMKWQNSTLNKGVHTGHQKDSHVRQSPISLDLDGNGLEVVSYQNGSQAVFDFNADGIMNHTSWIGKNDGILALDRDGDRLITSGQELFGDSTVLADGTKAAMSSACKSQPASIPAVGVRAGQNGEISNQAKLANCALSFVGMSLYARPTATQHCDSYPCRLRAVACEVDLLSFSGERFSAFAIARNGENLSDSEARAQLRGKIVASVRASKIARVLQVLICAVLCALANQFAKKLLPTKPQKWNAHRKALANLFTRVKSLANRGKMACVLVLQATYFQAQDAKFKEKYFSKPLAFC